MAIGTSLKISFDGNEVKRGLSSMKSDLGSAAKAAAKIGLAVGAVAAGLIYAAKKAIDLGFAINKMGEAGNTANARVQQMVSNTELFGDAAERVTMRITDLANETARKVGIDQKLIKEAQATVMSFRSVAATAGDVGGMFDRVIQASIDMGGNVEANAKKIARALEDPERGMQQLARSGVVFTNEQKAAILSMVESGDLIKAQVELMGNLESRFGGVAEATANASDKMKVGMQQIKESFAMGFADAFSSVPGQIDGVVAMMIEKVSPVGKRMGEIISDAFLGNSEDLVKLAGVIGESAADAFKTGFQIGFKALTGQAAGFAQDYQNFIYEKTGFNNLVGDMEYGDVIKDQLSLEGKGEMQELMERMLTRVRDVMQNRNEAVTVRSNVDEAFASAGPLNYRGSDDRAAQALFMIERNTRSGAKF
jgi:hypothetical protein